MHTTFVRLVVLHVLMAHIYLFVFVCNGKSFSKKKIHWRVKVDDRTRVAVPLASISDKWRHQCLLLSLALLHAVSSSSVKASNSVDHLKVPNFLGASSSVRQPTLLLWHTTHLHIIPDIFLRARASARRR